MVKREKRRESEWERERGRGERERTRERGESASHSTQRTAHSAQHTAHYTLPSSSPLLLVSSSPPTFGNGAVRAGASQPHRDLVDADV